MSDTCSLLLVEDDHDLREILCRALERSGCRVTCVGTPEGAREAVRTTNFHVAVIDRGLSGEDGLMLIEALRKHNNDLKTIVLCGWCDGESAAAAVARGAFECLSKLCRLAHLRGVVEQAYRASVARDVSTCF